MSIDDSLFCTSSFKMTLHLFHHLFKPPAVQYIYPTFLLLTKSSPFLPLAHFIHFCISVVSSSRSNCRTSSSHVQGNPLLLLPLPSDNWKASTCILPGLDTPQSVGQRSALALLRPVCASDCMLSQHEDQPCKSSKTMPELLLFSKAAGDEESLVYLTKGPS